MQHGRCLASLGCGEGKGNLEGAPRNKVEKSANQRILLQLGGGGLSTSSQMASDAKSRTMNRERLDRDKGPADLGYAGSLLSAYQPFRHEACVVYTVGSHAMTARCRRSMPWPAGSTTVSNEIPRFGKLGDTNLKRQHQSVELLIIINLSYTPYSEQ